MAVFSFHPVKHIACGEGGMVTMNSEVLYEKVKILRTHGITKQNMPEEAGGWYYEMQELGFNYRLTDIQAALGISQLAKNNAGVVRRNEIAKKYQDAFKGKIKFQEIPSNGLNAHHLFVIEIPNRKAVYEALKEKGIYAQIHYIPVHTLPYYRQIGYSGASLTNSESYYARCLSLPMYPTLKDEEQDFVISEVLKQ
jgi:dTDP-4-amino-4,6-dideoxygalactose transaminase